MPSAGFSAVPATQVTGIGLAEQGAATRVSIDLSRRAEYRVFFLNEPMRAVIDLPPVNWNVAGAVPNPRGLVAGYRYGLLDPQTARLVLDLSGPAKVRQVGALVAPKGAPTAERSVWERPWARMARR